MFYGWTLVAVGFVVTCIGMGAMMSLSIFLQPLSQAMGWSRAGISAAGLLNFLGMGLGSFVWGAMSDRFGTRAVVISGGVLLGGGLVAASQANTLLQFQLCFGVLVGLAIGSFYAPLTALTTKWFTENRSLAVALVSAGMGLGSTVLGPLVRGLITSYDWRVAMIVVGNIAWLVIIPAALLVREPARAAGLSSAGAGIPAGPELTAAQAFRTPQFAAVAFTHFCCCAAHSGPIFHMVSNAMDHGISAMTAATVFGVAGIGSLGGKILCGLIADRIGAKRMILIGLTAQATAIALYTLIGSAAAFYALALGFGFSYGGVMPLYAIVVREYFGAKIMGTVFGALGAVATLGMAIGPVAGGFFYDSFGSYFWLFAGSAGIGLGAVAIAATFRPPQPVQVPLPTPSLAG
ncbi:MAG TPA: MFS transporter [Verrucomicrobiae bacterium]|jgi:MFS family permease|nr:MFS transporter [Verrucomicrobiae bacterium]